MTAAAEGGRSETELLRRLGTELLGDGIGFGAQDPDSYRRFPTAGYAKDKDQIRYALCDDPEVRQVFDETCRIDTPYCNSGRRSSDLSGRPPVNLLALISRQARREVAAGLSDPGVDRPRPPAWAVSWAVQPEIGSRRDTSRPARRLQNPDPRANPRAPGPPPPPPTTNQPLIGAPGFEPGTSPTRTVRATRLRHAPMKPAVSHKPASVPEPARYRCRAAPDA